MSNIYNDALEPLGLKTSQRSILAQLDRAGPATVGLLAEALVLDAGALAHTLKPLRRDKLVRIDPDPDDRRGRVVSLTALGQKRFHESYDFWAIAQSRFEKKFGPERAKALQEALSFIVSDEFLADE